MVAKEETRLARQESANHKEMLTSLEAELSAARDAETLMNDQVLFNLSVLI